MVNERNAGTSNGSPMSGRPSNWMFHHRTGAASVARRTAAAGNTRRRLPKGHPNRAARSLRVGKLRLAIDVDDMLIPLRLRPSRERERAVVPVAEAPPLSDGRGSVPLA